LLGARDGVFALDCVAARFRLALHELELAAPARVFTVAGTCGAEAAPVAYMAGRYDGLGAVWFDAHGDLNTPASSPSGHFHGMVLRTLLGDGPHEFTDHIAHPLDPGRVLVAGARDLDGAERDYIESAGIGLVEGWPDDAARRVVEALRSAGVALFSVPDGPSMGSVAAAVHAVVDSFDVVGVGVVESCGREPGAAQTLASFLIDSGLWPAD
jgi:arginase family enzyme